MSASQRVDWDPPVLEDHLEYMGETPLPLGVDVAPLYVLPVERRREIHAAVLLDYPPEKYLPIRHCLIESRAWYEWHWRRGIDPDKIRPSLPQWKREAVIRRDGLVCRLCGSEVERDDVHIDHIVPWSISQNDDMTNLQVAHSTCNLRKGARV